MRALLISLILLLCLMLPGARAEGNAPIRIYIEGSDALALNSSAGYKVIVIGAEGTDWKYEAYLTGANLTGASPKKDAPTTGNVTSASFNVNVTAPSVKGAIELYVKVHRTVGGKEEWSEAVKHIEVVEPIKISCMVNNLSEIDLVEMEVGIYVDGVLIETQRINIPSGESTEVSAEWVSASPAPGEHLLEVKGDVDGDGRISTAMGDIYASKRFYVESEGMNLIHVMLGIGGVVAVLVGMLLIKRRKLR
ncbi:MAG: CARDB domain-containing protein [Candidatus Thermoplasmatota archaeon]